MNGPILRAVVVAFAMSVYLGCCQCATQPPGDERAIHRNMYGLTTEPQLQNSPETNEASRREVARVASRQRESLLYWVLVVGGAGLGAIIILSVLTVIFHKLRRRRSHTVDMRHKHSSTRQTSGPHRHNPLAGGHEPTPKTDTDRNYSNVTSLAPATTRVTDSVFSWGSEFDVVAGDQRENVYSNDYKIPPPDDHKKDGTKSANKDIYVNNFLW